MQIRQNNNCKIKIGGIIMKFYKVEVTIAKNQKKMEFVSAEDEI